MLQRFPRVSTNYALFALLTCGVACGGTAALTGSEVPVGDADGGITPSGEAGTTPEQPSGLPCDVDAVLKANCRQCHGASPGFGAPMPLVTHADLSVPAKSDLTKKVYELVAQRIHDDVKPMPQAPNARLNAADTKTIDTWVAAQAPSSTAVCGGPVTGSDGGGVTIPLACAADTHLRPASAWKMPKTTTDEYVCYGFDVKTASKRHVVAMAPIIGNSKIVHHVLLFQSDTAVSTTPSPCSGGGALAWRMVYGWAPGGKNIELPKEAGFPEEGTTHWVVQVHYSNANALDGETDDSGFDLCSTDQLRPNDADMIAFGTQSLTVQPHQKLEKTCTITLPKTAPYKNLHVIAAMPHEHKLGTSITTVVVPGGTGAELDLGSSPNFDFSTQPFQTLDQVITSGDVIKTKCAWNNVTDSPVSFGQKTVDEMCYSFTMYYPRIKAPLFTWSTPALGSTCN